LREIRPGHQVACHYGEQITDAVVSELVPVVGVGANQASATPGSWISDQAPSPPPVAPQSGTDAPTGV
jgi:hypothetical protein